MDNDSKRDSEMILEIIWLIFAFFHVIPLAIYLLYMKHIAEKRPWNIKIDSSFEPTVSIIIPTYNEATTIKRKLDNILESNYPKDKLEIIIVDSASNDNTFEIARKWSEENPKIRVKLLREDERRGMVKALNVGLKYAKGEIVVKTDADCLWLKSSLKNALKYMADQNVGSVAGLHILKAKKETYSVRTERTYREFYRWLRIGESKLYGTVLYEGELMLVKRKILDKIRFDEDIGADDVPTALRIAEQGYRAITAEDAYFVEQTPYTWKGKFRQKIRRARHVLQALWRYKYFFFKEKTAFHKLILPFEVYIYIINPLFTIPLTILSAAMITRYLWLLLLTPLLLVRWVREMLVTHIVNNLIMVLAMLMEAREKEKVTWQKIAEIR